MSTLTFKDKDEMYQITVKKEFLDRCEKPHLKSCKDLLVKYQLLRFLHNPDGAALIDLENGTREYWIDGVCLTSENPDEAYRIAHCVDFTYRLGVTLEK